MKPSNHSDGIEITSSPASGPNNAPRSTECNSNGSGRFAPAALIFAAWVAGTLMFEISALENVRSQSPGEHWGHQATMLKTWTNQETELAAVHSVLKGLNHVAQPQVKPYQVGTNSTARKAQASPLVVNASSISNGLLDSSKIRLSSHETEVHRLGLRLPRMNLPSAGETGQTHSTPEQE